jgi:DNA invertase Pin-like site-specific DNA recombinase
MLAVFAQWEREIIGERTKEALAAKREQRWDPSCTPTRFRTESCG